MFREILKKIVVQDSRNTGEQLGIDILFAEYLVHIGPAAREFAGKPSDTALLGFQSLFNEFPYRFHSEKILLTVPIRRFNITTKRGTAISVLKIGKRSKNEKKSIIKANITTNLQCFMWYQFRD